MAEPVIQTPSINGSYPDWGQVNIHVQGLAETDVKAISWSLELQPGEVRGTGPQTKAFTVGSGKRTGSITLYTPGAKRLRAALGDGYMKKLWSLSVHWKEPDGVYSSVEMTVRISKDGQDSSEGEAAFEVKMDLAVLELSIDGKRAW